MTIGVNSAYDIAQRRVLLLEADEAKASLTWEWPAELWQLSRADGLEAALATTPEEGYDAILLPFKLHQGQNLNTLLQVIRWQPEAAILVICPREERPDGLEAMHYGAQDCLIAGEFDAKQLERSLLHAIERQKRVNGFHHAALHDPLTHLANRNLFLSLVQQALERRNRNPDLLYAVLFLDLDDFKQINDHHGHLCGDRLLGEIARRLQSKVRASDVVARLGGDEFGILIGDLQEPLDVLPVVHRITQVLADPLHVGSKTLAIASSVGIALSDRNCQSAVEMLENADLAMYQAKLNGKGSYCVFNDWMEHEKKLLGQLETGFANPQEELLRICYRPVISARAGQIVGMETDIQCQASGWQSMPFGELIRLSGGSGMLETVNRWIFDALHHQLRDWDRRQPHDWRLLLQLAPEQLRTRDLAGQLEEGLLAGVFPPERFCLSLKESLLHHAYGFQELLPTLKALHKRGFGLYLEDFGGSYPVLTALRQIPIDTVRINLNEMAALLPNSPQRLRLIAPLLELVGQLGLELIIDGLRADDDLSLLPCLEGVLTQGPFFSAAVSGKEAEAWL